jgi:hypothetical protein
MIKKQAFIVALLLAMGQTVFAQLPEKAEDIAPLLYGKKIPEGVLTVPNGEGYQVYCKLLLSLSTVNPLAM